MSLGLDYEWVEVAASPDPLVDCTMAKLRILVNGQVVTAVEDDQGERDHVLVPLHQVAEWLVSNWHPLCHEPENNGDPQRPGFDSRHDLAFAGDGFILPSLSITPTGRATVLRWRPSKPAFSEIEFTRGGEERVSNDQFEHACSSLIDAVLHKMRADNVPSTALEEAWRGVRGLDDEERHFARAAALLGEDPFDLDDSVANDIVAFWQEVPQSLCSDALAASDAEFLQPARRWIEHGLAGLDEQLPGAARSEWSELRDSLRPLCSLASASSKPWRLGYDLARHVRREVPGGASSDPNGLGATLDIPYRRIGAVSQRLQGLVAADSPACVGTTSRDASRRFLQARSIGAFLSARDHGPSLLSTMATDFQQLTRAFAAEYLAPAEQLRERMRDGCTSATALGEEFGVSPWVISHQMENHNLR